MYLAAFHPFSDSDEFPFPDLLLLDIYMPNGDGFEVLSFLRERPEIHVPGRHTFQFQASH